MPDAHGGLINSRTYWTWTGPDGKPASGSTPPGGGARPFGIGSEAPASTQYQEQTYADGTKVLSRWEPGQDNWVQESVTVDPQIRQQYKDQQPDAAKDAGDQPRAPTTFPDGSLRERDPKTGEWTILATKPQGPVQNQAPELVTLPDGSKASWNPATSKWDIAFPAKPEKPEKEPGLPEPVFPAARPGQRTDLTGVASQAKTVLAGLNADVAAGRLTREQRDQKWATYEATVIAPARAAAAKEANDYAEEQERRQRDADARARSTEERQTRTAEDAARLAREKFSYEQGQDAVSNALKLLPYQADPSLSPSIAGIYNQIIPGAFQPGAFAFQLPNIDAIAASHVGPLVSAHETSVAPRPAAGAVDPNAAGPPGQAALMHSGAGSTAGLENVPFTPRPEMAAAAAGPVAPVTPGVPAGTPSPLQPGWEWLNGPAGTPRTVY